MAELNKTAVSGVSRSRRLKSLPKVDLTAMVDLAFLLITFFMLTTSLSKPAIINLTMPVGDEPGKVPDDRTMTVCLAGGDKILTYMGPSDHPRSFQTVKTSDI